MSLSLSSRRVPARTASMATRLGGALSAASLLTACAGAPLPSLGVAPAGVTGYTAASLLSPVGYTAKDVDATHIVVTARGTPETPRARLEKIATARAAELGRDNKLAAFKVDAVEPGIDCGKKVDGYKGTGSTGSNLSRVVVRASYAPTAADASWLPTRETFERLTAELGSDVIAAEDSAASARDVAAACGRK